MHRRLTFAVALILVCIAIPASGQEGHGKSLQFRDLPEAVRSTVQRNLNGARIKHIGKEKEDGVEQYEIETLVNGHARDFNVDLTGKLLVTEEATSIEKIPAAARAAIMKKVGGGKLTTVETFAKPGQALMYEAGYKDAKGTGHEVLVHADGTEAKS